LDFIATARRQMLAGQLQDGRERLVNSYAGLTDEEMLEPGVAGDWSVRDVLAHVAAWDRAQTGAYRMMLRGERPALLDLDEEANEAFNLENHERMKDLDVQEVVAELLAAREEMVEVLREVDNAALFSPAPGDEHAELSIAACISVSASHDEEHAEMIEDWRDSRSPQL
jgi:uncharacterized damage-inducible protein DinB